MFREPAAQPGLRAVEGRREVGREGEFISRGVGEGKLGGGGPEQKIKGVGVEGLDFKLGADIQGAGLVPEMRPEGGVVLSIQGGDKAGLGGDIATEAPELQERGLTRPEIEQVRRKRDFLRVIVTGVVGDAEQHGGRD